MRRSIGLASIGFNWLITNFPLDRSGTILSAEVDLVMAIAQDYSISKCSRKCAIGERELNPGELFYSVLEAEGEKISRKDIAAENWNGPSDSMIGWWRSEMPQAGPKKLRLAPNGVLLDTLAELIEKPGQEKLAYVLALLLVRRRVLSEEQKLNFEQSDAPSETWNLVCSADGRFWSVPLEIPEAEEVARLQDELTSLLFTEE